MHNNIIVLHVSFALRVDRVTWFRVVHCRTRYVRPMDAATAPTSPPFLGRPGDAAWLWAPVPVLALLLLFVPETAAPPLGGAVLLLNFLHLAATWTRLYASRERTRLRVAAFVLPVVLLGLSAAAIRAGLSGALLLLVFLCNLPHIGLQNYGFVRIATRRSQRDGSAPDGPLDAWIDWLYCVSVPTWLAARFAARPGARLFGEGDALLTGLPPVFWTVTGAAVGTIALAAWARVGIRHLRGTPLPPDVVALHACYGPVAAAALFLLPSPLAPLPLMVGHYVQYLVVVRRWHVRAAESGAAGGAWGRAGWPLYLLGLALLAPGIPAVTELLLSDVLGGAMMAFGAAASLHHFWVDGRLWRLRDADTGRVLVS